MSQKKGKRCKTDGLPKYCFARGQQIWIRFKDEKEKWVNRPTPYLLNQIDLAKRYLNAVLKGVAQKSANGTPTGMLTVAEYARKWLDERDARGIPSAQDERARLEKYAFPYVGDLGLEEFKLRHVRDMIRGLRAMKGTEARAPRTIIHVYRDLYSMFESAVMDEHILTNPVKVPRGEKHRLELPKKVDKDPEWRSRATYTVKEVERMYSEPIIPVERRVQYALKAIAGLRHGEAAALCWRHIDETLEPLAKLNVVQAYCSRRHVVKGTKTGETRAVPVHPTLARILKAWKDKHWKRIYGREPKDDDFIVPARTMRPIAVKDAGEAMKRDLGALGLRVDAGTHRDRGGHDLRSWYKTRCIEDGADSLVIRRTTHAPPKDVDGGYERFSWETMCREVGKLKCSLPEGEVLKLVTSSLPREEKVRNRWTKTVTPLGLERNSYLLKIAARKENSEISVEDPTSQYSSIVKERTNSERKVTSRPLRRLERAILEGDGPRALQILRQLDALGVEVPAIEPTRPPRVSK